MSDIIYVADTYLLNGFNLKKQFQQKSRKKTGKQCFARLKSCDAECFYTKSNR